MDKISVIVPVYKVEPYLRTCIDSLLAQTYTNYELILVDDGSPDNCGAICDEYAAKDKRITVIHQKNGGLSAARNTGIDWVFENSDSQWITFVDSDDALAPRCLTELYRVAMETGADIVSTFCEFFENESELSGAGEYIGPVTTMSGQEACLELYRSKQTVTINATGKLFAAGLLNRLRFPVGKIHEDQNLVPQIVYGAKKISCLRSWLYYYRQTPGSITNASFSAKRFDDIDALNTCIDFFEKHGENEIVLLAKRHRNQLHARMTFTARQEGIYDQVPEQYRMGIIRAGAIIFAGTFRSGGINFVLKRIRNLIGQVTKKV